MANLLSQLARKKFLRGLGIGSKRASKGAAAKPPAPAKSRAVSPPKPRSDVFVLHVPKARAKSLHKTLEQVGFQLLGEAQTGEPRYAKQRRREAADLELLRQQLAEQIP